MSKLSKGQVRHVARLAGLKLTSEEISRFSIQLSQVLTYISQLNEVDTSSVEPTSQTTGLEDVLRKDKVGVGGGLSEKEAKSKKCS